jgi:diguanylate cyclase
MSMIAPEQQYRDTLATAASALDKIGELNQPVDPRSYALWYGYATGNQGLLSAAMNTRLSRTGTLTLQDIEELYSGHIAPGPTPERVDRLGGRIAGEIAQMLTVVEEAAHSSGRYSSNLGSACRRLGNTTDRAGVYAIVQGLVQATQSMTAVNARLQEQLQAMSEEIAQLRREIDVLRSENESDPLTSLGNRRWFVRALEKSVVECNAAGAPLTLLMADIDRLKIINESYGHVAGDRVLRFVATTLRDGITGRDVAARFGENAFAVMLPRTPLAPAVGTAEQLRHAIMKCELVKRSTGERQSRLTVSIGVATLHQGLSAQALTETAELCLHAAKRSGRNCVVSEADEKLYALAGRSRPAVEIPFPKP